MAIKNGATELDFVINYPRLKAGFHASVLVELQILRSEFRPFVLKLILETSQLSGTEIVAGCLLASAANFDFVKTSTGYNGHGATVEHVELMRNVADIEAKGMGVKASGGIRTGSAAKAMLLAGATRLGLSRSVSIHTDGKTSNSFPVGG